MGSHWPDLERSGNSSRERFILHEPSPLRQGVDKLKLAFTCRRGNDLYEIVSSQDGRTIRYDDPAQAIDGAGKEGGALILAEEYPSTGTRIEESWIRQASENDVRLFVEYPSSMPGLSVGKPITARWERAVVTSDCFGPELARMRILDLHGCSFVPLKATDPCLVLARVAGFDSASYGLPATVYPLLFKHPGLDFLISTTKLTNFVTARYSPTEAWAYVWRTILSWLTRDTYRPEVHWTPTVRPRYGKEQVVPNDVELDTFMRGIRWFHRSGIIVARNEGTPEGVDMCRGDGTKGIYEGFSSLVRTDGSQPMAKSLRNDCIGEAAGAIAIGALIRDDEEGRKIASNLNDYIYHHSVFAKGPRADPESPSYGLLSWAAHPPSDGIYYGDDNARSMLGTMLSSAVLKSSRWDEGLLRCLMANLRTTGTLGFRGHRLEEPELQEKGWQHFASRSITDYAPHYEAYLWACFLWAFRATGYAPFLEKARSAIAMTMEAYPDEWEWTNGIAQERARFLLPLAWLVRVEDTAEHRSWLRAMGEEVISRQDRCGALREEIGGPGKGHYGPPRSNDEYGTNEATLLEKNGDPICDMLYTTNFAFLGLREAAEATRETIFINAEERLAKFLCRIQVRSEKHPELDGAWFRGFDFGRWDYWASNADLGWGVWSIESGWTQSWIVSVLGLRQMKTSLWEIAAQTEIALHLKGLLKAMLPEER